MVDLHLAAIPRLIGERPSRRLRLAPRRHRRVRLDRTDMVHRAGQFEPPPTDSVLGDRLAKENGYTSVSEKLAWDVFTD